MCCHETCALPTCLDYSSLCIHMSRSIFSCPLTRQLQFCYFCPERKAEAVCSLQRHHFSVFFPTIHPHIFFSLAMNRKGTIDFFLLWTETEPVDIGIRLSMHWHRRDAMPKCTRVFYAEKQSSDREKPDLYGSHQLKSVRSHPHCDFPVLGFGFSNGMFEGWVT